MNNPPRRTAPSIGASESARRDRQRAIRSAAAVLDIDDPDARNNEERCPSCDTAAAWQISRRHRFSPFGSVLLAVLAFWSAALSWLLGFGLMPALVPLAGAVFISMATRKAEVCEACGYVRRLRR